MNGLPLESQRKEILSKRRHGMGFLGLGSALSMLGIPYGSVQSVDYTSKIAMTIAVESYRVGVELAKEKGCAPVLKNKKNRQKWIDGEYMQRIWKAIPHLKRAAMKYGCRYTHATSIAPTGTISFSVNNNASNGIEPTFSHKYTRNVIKPGRKTKIAETVYSYEMLLYKHVTGEDDIPRIWSTTDNVTPEDHIKIQAAAQFWCDSSISKTVNVPTDTPFEDFKNIYLMGYEMGLKGCTTFRFNPETLQGVLVKDSDLSSTEYVFTLEDGTEITTRGNDSIMYDGEEHSAQNLFDAIQEGYYGKL